MSASNRPEPGSGRAMHAFISDLYPICRSITGAGLRETLARIATQVPLDYHDVPTGTAVLDWTVPREWNIRDAWVADAAGKRVIDFRCNNLHVMSYSVPVRRRMTLAELRPHLHTLPDRPDLIPYRTSYYADAWGFCLAQGVLDAMPDGEYDVCIDSTLEPGNLTYGEAFLPGSSSSEILISTHCCHPSLANDNLSGVAVAVWLARYFASHPHRHGLRFLFMPTTIGAITWLSRNRASTHRIAHGLVLSCVGDAGRSTYKRSRRGDAIVDRAAAHVLRHSGDHELLDFGPYGYDERQYCSPGFDLPVGCLMRTPNGKFPEYHTSADNLEFVQPAALEDSLAKAMAIIGILERDQAFVNLKPFGEPQLGKRGLYQNKGGSTPPLQDMALLWVLSYSDGRHTLLDIAERAAMPFDMVADAATRLVDVGLLASVEAGAPAIIAGGTAGALVAPPGQASAELEAGGGP